MVRLGEVNARRYHACLLMGSLVCLALFNLFSLHSLWGWLFLLAAPLLVKQARYVMRKWTRWRCDQCWNVLSRERY